MNRKELSKCFIHHMHFINYPSTINIEKILIGDPTEYMPIINFIIVGYSPEIAKLVDVDISGLTDRLFITYIFKFVEKHFHIDANMSVDDFFTPKKCIHRKMNYVIELINSIRKYLQHDVAVYPPITLYNNNKEYNPNNSYLHVLNMSNINSEINSILKIDKIKKPLKKVHTIISSSSSSSSASSDGENSSRNEFKSSLTSSPLSFMSKLSLLSSSNSDNDNNDIGNSIKPIKYHKPKLTTNQSSVNNTHISFEDKTSDSFNNSSLLPSNPNISIESDNKNVNVTIIPNSSKNNSFDENSNISKQLQQILEEMSKMNNRLERLEERMSKIESKT